MAELLNAGFLRVFSQRAAEALFWASLPSRRCGLCEGTVRAIEFGRMIHGPGDNFAIRR